VVTRIFEYARRALRLGATDYIDKPLTIEKMQSLFRILDEKEAVKRNEEQIFAEKDKEIIQNSGVESKDMHAAIVIALDYIQNHFTEDIGLLELSDLVDMNPAYLSVLFKEQVGISFIKYLTKLRIERAKELLASGMRASDAGIAVGYNDSHYFYDIFKRNTGMTATEYKEQL
jgi:two-component system response regulator YesN